ncbi:MAG: hypothetical protein R3202_12580 [Candidatus Competibacterales bacterium]|nr:hypothetical protein [Candidatus Competibacterales bacterium]
MAPLERLQQRLQHLYEIELDHRVSDFVITDAALARYLEGDPAARTTPEKLLVRQQGEDLELSLYLDPELLERLAEDDPETGLHGGNLADFCTALEGVSHFLYLIWNAGHGRSVTPLELEMQAEIDKYVLSARALRHHRRAPAQLHYWLFDRALFDAGLSGPELERYRAASHYAGTYCGHLADRYLAAPDTADRSLLNELRRFYRLPLHHKIRRIERLH